MVICQTHNNQPTNQSTQTAIKKEGEPLTIFTSILPQTYFVERIGGDRVDVQALVPPGSSPATYEPSPKQMVSLAEADVFFSIGVPFEKALMPKINNVMQDLNVVKTQADIELREMKKHHHTSEKNADAHTHEHKHENGHDHKHNHSGKDPHIWLSPRLVKVQATTIANGLIKADPAGKAVYEENLAKFHADLDALDDRLADSLAPVKGKTFMVFHPAWGYLADDYGLKQQPIEVEGKDPSGQQLARMIELAKAQDVQVIFVQPQFDMKSAKHIAAQINGVVVAINPLAVNYIENMEKIADSIREGLQNQSDAS